MRRSNSEKPIACPFPLPDNRCIPHRPPCSARLHDVENGERDGKASPASGWRNFCRGNHSNHSGRIRLGRNQHWIFGKCGYLGRNPDPGTNCAQLLEILSATLPWLARANLLSNNVAKFPEFEWLWQKGIGTKAHRAGLLRRRTLRGHYDDADTA